MKSIQDENPISHSLINAISKQFSTFQNLIQLKTQICFSVFKAKLFVA